jgi:L-asparaginase
MAEPFIQVLATGGTIAGTAGSALRRDYRPGQIGIESFLANAGSLGLDAKLVGQEIAAIGSEDMSPAVWARLHGAAERALADERVAGIVVTGARYPIAGWICPPSSALKI